jgi:hypothetical protein
VETPDTDKGSPSGLPRQSSTLPEKKRLDINRPMTTVTIRMPEDVAEDLKRIALLLDFSDYQPLIRAYIAQGLREDLEKLGSDTVSTLSLSVN